MFKVILELLAQKQLRFEEGKISLFYQEGLMTPVLTLVEIQKLLEDKGKENILYYGAKSSGAEWIRRIFKIYEMDTIDEQVKWGEKTFTLAGNGKMEVTDWNTEKSVMIYKVEDSIISKVYGKSDHAVDCIPRGWFAGASCVFFNRDVDAVETKCKAKGDDYCEFVVKPRDKFNMEKKEIRRQLKKI